MVAFPTEVLNKLILADTKPGGGYGANQFNARGTVRVANMSATTVQPLALPSGSGQSPALLHSAPTNSGTTNQITAATLPQFLREKYPNLCNTRLGNDLKQYNANMARAMNERHIAEKNHVLQQNLWLADKICNYISSSPLPPQHSASTGRTQASRSSSVKRGHNRDELGSQYEADNKECTSPVCTMKSLEDTPNRSTSELQDVIKKKSKTDGSALDDDSKKIAEAAPLEPYSPATTKLYMEHAVVDLMMRSEDI